MKIKNVADNLRRSVVQSASVVSKRAGKGPVFYLYCQKPHSPVRGPPRRREGRPPRDSLNGKKKQQRRQRKPGRSNKERRQV